MATAITPPGHTQAQDNHHGDVIKKLLGVAGAAVMVTLGAVATGVIVGGPAYVALGVLAILVAGSVISVLIYLVRH
ncbi:hypothetical protein Ade02nite_64840 [Paractinoplanes deccanensis]|uniref:Uncharacterized protein n=1 Tax=Paractinoplanes deccanensis TaxID=113561 RepID=A0ABQ3YCU8_9ACTN|nr:hypothetical protein [Actinoplanes deccanensis]GID77843.1 hypothetical protein Ade02nite_64840 [Actinoplanes deccanensis]